MGWPEPLTILSPCSRGEISYSVVTWGFPSITMLLFAVVPPMSKEMIFSLPARPPIYAAAITPPTGPDSIVFTALLLASLVVMSPPLACITRS